ncbi:Rhomboid family protein [Rubripirellula lacrimiformis]|uniref:Rhomboid family protein n=1 Tax=Rubripirellula lacrimiformis TaxID=1930273 RepID=A0A517N3T0_9BACT|nr:rhomboid family intramembrane serine protease [Rubripirellula lacrimiformis]QDT01648.1 Rhomboid family protein [Rubripirellula lacrimiformis]
MGLYDRDYGRQERTAWDRIENPRSITIILIVVTVAVFFLEILFQTTSTVRIPGAGDMQVKTSPVADWLAVYADTLYKPWMWWQFLSYGFVHDFQKIFHILFNMLGLFFFGRIIEQKLGQMEFLRFYLVAIVFGGIVASITNLITFQIAGVQASTIGASGAVVATVILFACHYPHQQIYLMMVFPVKAWVAAVLFVAMDVAGALGLMASMGSSGNTAFTVHLAGAAFALVYFFQRWNLRFLSPGALTDIPARMRDRSRRMKIKLHDPDKKLEKEAEDADRILAKIHQQGESSLTAAERKVLERYSRRQREKRNQ